MNFSKEKKLFLILHCINKLNEPFITRIQKTLFIYTQEFDENLLTYIPNNFGPNSFELSDEISFLVNNNFINEKLEENATKYYLIKRGKEILKNASMLEKYEKEIRILWQIVNYANDWGSLLVGYVYKNYPKYIEKSLILNEVVERMSDDRKRDATRSIEILRKKIQESRNK